MSIGFVWSLTLMCPNWITWIFHGDLEITFYKCWTKWDGVSHTADRFFAQRSWPVQVKICFVDTVTRFQSVTLLCMRRFYNFVQMITFICHQLGMWCTWRIQRVQGHSLILLGIIVCLQVCQTTFSKQRLNSIKLCKKLSCNFSTIYSLV